MYAYDINELNEKGTQQKKQIAIMKTEHSHNITGF